jgi:hypothetical protein
VKQKPPLRIAPSPRDAWEGAIRGWFANTIRVSWTQPLPSLVVVPTRSHALALKARLLDEGKSNLGIRFVTPAGLRELLSSATNRPLPRREHLRLLLAIAADQTLREIPDQEQNADDLAAKAVVRAPDHLLRTLNRLATAGWNFEDLGLTAFQPIVRRFREQLRACDFSLLAQFDREVLASSSLQPPLFANLLITGFDAAHWSHWFLLRTAVNLAEEATVILEYPRENSDIDLCWIGSWEEALGEAEPISSRAPKSGDSLFTDAEMRGIAAPAANYRFLVGADAPEEAEAIALLCVRFLAEKGCETVGVVFAGAGALSRLVATALGRLDIPHHDGLAHFAPGSFESDDWRAWLELQRSPRIGSLLRFFNALPNATEIFPGLTERMLDTTLRDAYAELLIDDLEVLREFCAGQPGDDARLIADAIDSLGSLPARATLAEFVELTHAACTRLDWKQRWLEIARRIDGWIEKVPAEISRSLFLRWLEEVASSFVLERSARGDHPYARVQLLTVPQACGREWSHLIFAGWNEGSWPPPASGELMREDEIDAFNRKVRQLNRRAARHGKQGEGHETIREGHTLYLGPVEQRRIALRQFDGLRESATKGIALAASLIQESAPERLWNPNELFTRLFQESEGRPLTEDSMACLQKATKSWLAREAGLTNGTEPKITVTQTRVAYQARRDPSAQAGEYDFAFRGAAPVVPILSVSEIESLLSAPALVWIRKYLGVRAPEDDASVWNTSTGKWIHDWLARIGGAEKTFVRLPDAGEIDRQVCASAQEKRAQVARLCESARRPLPDWWESGHRHALFLARALGEKLATAESWPWMATEWRIESDLPVQVAAGVAMSFRGRIDLLLARQPLEAGSLAAEELWIVDHKTGAKKPLSGSEDVEKRKAALRKKLLDSTALQLALYALAAQSLGAKQTWVSLLSPLVRPLAPQLSGADIAAEQDIFAELARMQQSGQFGMHGVLRSAFRFTEDYPLATLAIDPDILEQRWEKTHPALVREEEDIFW